MGITNSKGNSTTTTSASTSTDWSNGKHEIATSDETRENAGETVNGIVGHSGVETVDYSFETDVKDIKHCVKNPDHADFIRIGEFTLDKLPLGYKDQCLLDYVRAHAQAVVHITATAISEHRPEHFPKSSRKYPFFLQGGGHLFRRGSGWVSSVTKQGNDPDVLSVTTSCRSFDSEIYEPEQVVLQVCPCRICKNSECPKDKWWEIEVVTAKHVLYDEVEVQDAVVQFFYDDVSSETITLHGGKAADLMDVTEDRCEFTCYTHDQTVGTRLQTMMAHCRQLELDMYELEETKYKESHGDQPVFVVSHPHGVVKQVSVGRLLTSAKDWNRLGDNFPPETLTYTACTCPGSSGGWVWWAGRKGLWYYSYPHSAGRLGGSSKSGALR